MRKASGRDDDQSTMPNTIPTYIVSCSGVSPEGRHQNEIVRDPIHHRRREQQQDCDERDDGGAPSFGEAPAGELHLVQEAHHARRHEARPDQHEYQNRGILQLAMERL